MLTKFLSPGLMAGAALTALTHTGLFAAVYFLQPSWGGGPLPEQSAMVVTLVDVSVVADAVEPDPVPAPEPEPLPEPEPESVRPVGGSMPGPGTENPPVKPDVVTERAIGPAGETDKKLVKEIADEIAVPDAGTMFLADPSGDAVHDPSGDTGPGLSSGSDEQVESEMTEYLLDVRKQLARHAPKGVAGASDCKVAFQLSAAGAVESVGLQQSSGNRVYDRRCLKAVAASAPFPSAPVGAAPSDLSFTIVMKQKR